MDVANLMVRLWMSPAALQVSPAESRGIIGCSEHRHMCCEGSSDSPGVSSGIQEVSFDVANLVVCLWTSPAGLQVSPGVSSRIQEVSLDVANVDICLAKPPVSLQVSPAESRRYH